MKVLVTGSAGFIGFHLAQKLIERGDEVVGIDNINDYYDIKLKFSRLELLGINEPVNGDSVVSTQFNNFKFQKLDIADQQSLEQLFKYEKFDCVANLAAQAGVRYSIDNPQAYIESNLVGFANILECCRNNDIQHLVYASSSSVYGLNQVVPFSTKDPTNHPISLYAATKKSNELLAHSYSHLYNLPTTGIRFFTVYGPWGRPDMAYLKFAHKIVAGETIDVYNNGEMQRDFTYIDDIVEGAVKILDQPTQPDAEWSPSSLAANSSSAPYRVFNIGKNAPVNLLKFIEILENALGRKAEKNFMPMQPGDVTTTWADVNDLIKQFDYQPNVDLNQGIAKFVAWFKSYYNV